MTERWTRAIVVTPRHGGADGVSAVSRAYVEALASPFGARIGRVDVWTLDEPARDRDPVVPATSGATIQVRCARGRRLVFVTYGLRERAVDPGTLVVVQHVHLLPAVLPLVARGARVVIVMHGIEAWTRLRPVERLACRAAWKRAAVSAHTRRRFLEANPELASLPVEVCAPGLPSAAPTPSLAVPGLYALIVARMHAAERYKGHDELIEIWPRVRARVPDARLVIAGGGDDSARLELKAAALGVADAVTFEGVVDEARLHALYRHAAVFAMPSLHEGFGLVYVEAMRAGVPCIVAPGAAEEIVDHERTGLVIPGRDAAALERALVRLLTRHDERSRMGAAAREAAGRFSADAFRRRLAALLEIPSAPAPLATETTAAC